MYFAKNYVLNSFVFENGRFGIMFPTICLVDD